MAAPTSGASQNTHELGGCTVGVEEGDAGGPRRIDRGIRDRNAHQVNERQAQPDGQPRETLGCAVLRRPQNDPQEYRGQHDLGNNDRPQRKATGRVRAKTIGGHIADGIEIGLALRDHENGQPAQESTDHLREPVRHHGLPLDAPGDGGSKGYRRVEMPT